MVEQCHKYFPHADIHVLVRDGNETVLHFNPHVKKIWRWHKKKNKYWELLKTAFKIRQENFDVVINVQRFFSSGLVTLLSQAKIKIGFTKNPLSFFYDEKIVHDQKVGHEVQRNFKLLLPLLPDQHTLPNEKELRPCLYFGHAELSNVTNSLKSPYIVMAPTSVWFTKQWSSHKWTELLNLLPAELSVFLVGAPSDYSHCEKILTHSVNRKSYNLAGKLSIHQTALLMKKAMRVIVNDSAPMHLASCVNAPTTAIFCSTIPEFGFGPLSDDCKIVQVRSTLKCRPCGIHGKSTCPLEHFNCAEEISIDQVLATL